jgi:guanine nucleotide-binding protein subunit alpha
VAIHAGKQGKAQRVSAVSVFVGASGQNLIVYYSITQATDTSNIRLVFAAVANTIIKNSLEDTGIL